MKMVEEEEGAAWGGLMPDDEGDRDLGERAKNQFGIQTNPSSDAPSSPSSRVGASVCWPPQLLLLTRMRMGAGGSLGTVHYYCRVV